MANNVRQQRVNNQRAVENVLSAIPLSVGCKARDIASSATNILIERNEFYIFEKFWKFQFYILRNLYFLILLNNNKDTKILDRRDTKEEKQAK